MRVSQPQKPHRRSHKNRVTARPPKPAVTIDSTVGGRLIIGNTTAAAKWLGMRQQDFYRIVKNILRPPKRVVAYQKKVDAVKAAYPELFEEAK